MASVAVAVVPFILLSCGAVSVDDRPPVARDATPTADAGAHVPPSTDADFPPSPGACTMLSDASHCAPAADAGAPPQIDPATCALCLGGRGAETIDAVSVDASGSITVTGTFESVIDLGGGPLSAKAGSGMYLGAVFAARYDASCNHIWSKRFGQGTRLTIDRAGGLLIVPYPGAASWIDPAGAVHPIAASQFSPKGAVLDVVADPVLGITVALASDFQRQGGGGGAIITPARIQRYNTNLELVWQLASTGLIAMDRKGDVFVYEADATTPPRLSKVNGATGATLWCIGVPSGGVRSMKAHADGSVTLAGVGGPQASTLNVVGVSATACIMRDELLPLPMPMAAIDGAAYFRGSVAISEWGDVHVASADGHIKLASFSRAGTLIGSADYGRTGLHPAPSIAVGPSGELVVAGGFSREGLDLGTTTLENSFRWSTDAFVARNPSYASLGTTSPAEPVPAGVPMTLRSKAVQALATGGGSLYWVEQGVALPQFDLYRCAPPACDVGQAVKLGTLPGYPRGLAASAAGVAATGGVPSLLLRCPGDVCTTLESPPTSPRALAARGASLAFTSDNGNNTVQVSTCSLNGCAAATTIMPTIGGAYPYEAGLFLTAAAVSLGVQSTSSCPVTGCGTNPPAGTNWVSFWPNKHLASDDASVYVQDPEAVTGCSFSGCGAGVSILAGGLGAIGSYNDNSATSTLATDGVSIYFLDLGTAAKWVPSTGVRLLKCPVGGCPAGGAEVLWVSPPLPVPGGISRPLTVAVDSANVYFTALQADGTTVLAMLPK